MSTGPFISSGPGRPVRPGPRAAPVSALVPVLVPVLDLALVPAWALAPAPGPVRALDLDSVPAAPLGVPGPAVLLEADGP